MAYSGDIVSRKAFKPYQLLQSFARYSLDCRTEQHLLKALEISGANRIETSSFKAKKQTKMIGFSVFDLFIVSDNDYIDVGFVKLINQY